MELPSLPTRRRTRRRWTLGAVLLLLAVGVAAYLLRRAAPGPAPETVPPVAQEAEPPRVHEEAAPPLTGTLPPAPPGLPPLADSDAFARDVAGTLTAHPAFAAWLANEALVRRFVAVVDDVADGVSPRPLLGFLAPAEKFGVIHRGERVFLDPQSYARYDQVADVVASVDPEGCADAYRRLRPLLEEGYGDLGRRERTFEQALHAALARLLATPVVEGDVELAPRVITYGFADPALEGRSAVEKDLLRMGPRNVRRIQDRLRQIAAALGMSELG